MHPNSKFFLLLSAFLRNCFLCQDCLTSDVPLYSGSAQPCYSLRVSTASGACKTACTFIQNKVLTQEEILKEGRLKENNFPSLLHNFNYPVLINEFTGGAFFHVHIFSHCSPQWGWRWECRTAILCHVVPAADPTHAQIDRLFNVY